MNFSPKLPSYHDNWFHLQTTRRWSVRNMTGIKHTYHCLQSYLKLYGSRSVFQDHHLDIFVVNRISRNLKKTTTIVKEFIPKPPSIIKDYYLPPLPQPSRKFAMIWENLERFPLILNWQLSCMMPKSSWRPGKINLITLDDDLC